MKRLKHKTLKNKRAATKEFVKGSTKRKTGSREQIKRLSLLKTHLFQSQEQSNIPYTEYTKFSSNFDSPLLTPGVK